MSDILDPEFIKTQRAHLEAMMLDLEERSRQAKRAIRDMEHEVGDSVDTSAEELDTAAILQLKKNESETMRQIEEALERMGDGEYGECEECGDAIGQRRLEVKPFALMCVACQEEVERDAKRRVARPGLIDEYM